MQKLLIALLLSILSLAAEAGELKISRRFEHDWKTLHWLTFHHVTRSKRSHIIALNQKNLQLEILDASSGQTLLQDRLDTQAKHPEVLEAYSALSGEFLVALARPDHVVEVHSIDDPVSFEVPISSAPRQLALIEREPGDVYLVVTTSQQIAVYHRADSELRLVQKLNWKSGIEKTQSFSTRQGQLLIEFYDSPGKLHLIELDFDKRKFRGRLRLERPSLQVEGFLTGNEDYLVAFTTDESARLHALSLNTEIAHLPLSGDLGKSGWLKSANKQPWFLALQRDSGAPTLAIYDAYAPKVPVRLSPGSAQKISLAGAFSVRGKSYFHYVKDDKTLHMQNSQELSAISTRRDERIADVEVVRDAQNKNSKLLVVRLDSDTGSRLQVLELH